MRFPFPQSGALRQCEWCARVHAVSGYHQDVVRRLLGCIPYPTACLSRDQAGQDAVTPRPLPDLLGKFSIATVVGQFQGGCGSDSSGLLVGLSGRVNLSYPGVGAALALLLPRVSSIDDVYVRLTGP